MDLEEMKWGGDWIDLAQDRDNFWAVVNAVMNFVLPHNVNDTLTKW